MLPEFSTWTLSVFLLSLSLFTALASPPGAFVRRSPMPDTADLAESVLAPFLLHGRPSLAPGGGGAVVCGGGAAAPRVLLPATLRDIARVVESPRVADGRVALDAAAGCFLRAAGRDLPCAADVLSDPVDCDMRITDATNYWRFSGVPQGAVRNGAAEVLVEDITRIGEVRARLRRSFRRTKEVMQAGKQLWLIASKGWDCNARKEDQVAFASAVTARGKALVKDAYDDVMVKYKIVKDWMQSSLGLHDDASNTYNGRNGSLLSPESYCDISTRLDEWMSLFDQVYYGHTIVSSVQREIVSLFSKYKNFEETSNVDIDSVHHLPCVTFSFAVAMMLLEDFPFRKTHWDVSSNTREDDGDDDENDLWPLSRFAMLGDPNATVTRNRQFLLRIFEDAMGILTGDRFVRDIFNGDASVASCVAHAALRTPISEGQTPPGSIYECFQSPTPTEAEDKSDSFFVSKGDDPAPKCPWGFTRASGNHWDAQEQCVMCPVGSFDDLEGGCRCSEGSYPTSNGCEPKEERDAEPTVIWRWSKKSSEIFVVKSLSSSSSSINNRIDRVPFFVATLPDTPDARENDTIVVDVTCTTGLTQFDIVLQSPSHSVTPGLSVGVVSLPDELQRDSPSPRRFLRLTSASMVSLSVAASAAAGAEECRMDVRLRNARFGDGPPLPAGALTILPAAAAPRVDAGAPADGVPDCGALPDEPTMGSVALAICRAAAGKLGLRVDARGYAPLSPDSYGILRQALWEDGDRAEALGVMLRSALERTVLTLQVKGESFGFEGIISLAEGIRLFPFSPGKSANVAVRLQATDHCAMSNGKVNHSLCKNKKLAFADSEVATETFVISGLSDMGSEWTDDSAVSHNTNDVGELSGRNWWYGPLIALGVIDTLLVVTIGALVAIMCHEKAAYARLCERFPRQMELNSQDLQESTVDNELCTHPSSPSMSTRDSTPELV